MTSWTSGASGAAARGRGDDHERAEPSIATLHSLYGQRRLRVASAYQKMQAIAVGIHQPAEARQCAADLASAIGDATATASQALGMLRQPVASRRRWRRHKAVRTVPSDVRRWSVELLRLTEIDEWLRRTTLDDLGVHLPTVVRVASRAASGPHIAGMVMGADEPVESILRDGRIGIALLDVVDGSQSHPRPESRITASAPIQAA
jgi:hypothetical protein